MTTRTPLTPAEREQRRTQKAAERERLMDEHVARTIASFPPMTPERRARIVALLNSFNS